MLADVMVAKLGNEPVGNLVASMVVRWGVLSAAVMAEQLAVSLVVVTDP